MSHVSVPPRQALFAVCKNPLDTAMDATVRVFFDRVMVEGEFDSGAPDEANVVPQTTEEVRGQLYSRAAVFVGLGFGRFSAIASPTELRSTL